MISNIALVDLFKKALSEKWGYIWGTAGIVWTQARQNQKVNYMISKYGENWKKNADAKNDHYYNACLYGAKWIGHTVSDCSGMFVWAFKQFNIGMSHISSNIYLNYCTTKGKLTSELKKTIPAGTAVFTGSSEKNHPHVGLYVGDGKVIEASGTQAGVCTSNITASKWTYYGLLKNVSYDGGGVSTPVPTPVGNELPTLKKGSKGEYVKKLQKRLMELGYSLPKYGADGDFGNETIEAVKAFQKDHGLTVDGIVGEKTWKAMDKNETVVYYDVVVKHLTSSQADEILKLYDNAHKEVESK